MTRRFFLKAAAACISAAALVQLPWRRPAPQPPLIPRWQTPDGWTVAQIHYSQVPGYPVEAARVGLTDEAWRQECEVDWSGK